MFYDHYLESVRLLNEMRDEGFNMTAVATRLRDVRDEMRAIDAEQIRVANLAQHDNESILHFPQFPLLTMMNLVEEEHIRSLQVNPNQLIESQARIENHQIRELERESRDNKTIKKQRERGELIRYKVLAKQKLEKLCDNECVICQDKHKVKDTIITDCCSNFYCVPCLTEWTRRHNSCPTCRKVRPTTLGFRQRTSPKLALAFDVMLNH